MIVINGLDDNKSCEEEEKEKDKTKREDVALSLSFLTFLARLADAATSRARRCVQEEAHVKLEGYLDQVFDLLALKCLHVKHKALQLEAQVGRELMQLSFAGGITLVKASKHAHTKIKTTTKNRNKVSPSIVLIRLSKTKFPPPPHPPLLLFSLRSVDYHYRNPHPTLAATFFPQLEQWYPFSPVSASSRK